MKIHKININFDNYMTITMNVMYEYMYVTDGYIIIPELSLMQTVRSGTEDYA